MPELSASLNKAKAGERLDADDALILFHEADLLTLGNLAAQKRHQLHPEPDVTFVVDRNINYTNICMSGCLFCAFYRSIDARCDPLDAPGGQKGGYVITEEELGQKIEETLALGGTQILLQGGMHPKLELDYYTDLLTFIHAHYPIHVHGFSPPEIDYIAKKSGLSVEKTLERLIDAGLNSIPGGGAEILSDEIRQKVSPNKCSADEWLGVMETAHKLGLRTTATMMFGHLEEPRHIIEHLVRIRNLQDKTGGFTAFIPWTFQPMNTRIDVVPKTAVEYLRVLALSRIFLDNVDNVQASWVTQGDKIAQTALAFGANDLGSTMIEENVVAAAGVTFRLPKSEMIRLIRDAGFRAVRRDCFYNHLEIES